MRFVAWFLTTACLSVSLVLAENVAMTRLERRVADGNETMVDVAIAVTGSSFLIQSSSASSSQSIDLPSGISSVDDVAIDPVNPALMFVLSTSSRAVCSYRLSGSNDDASLIEATLVSCITGGFNVGPFSGVSAYGGTLMVSGGTGGFTVYNYNGSTGQIESSASLFNRELSNVIGHPDVLLVSSELAALSTDFSGGGSRFGTLLVTLPAAVQTRDVRVSAGSLGFDMSIGPANFPLVNAAYDARFLYTANGSIQVASLDATSTSPPLLLGVSPSGSRAVTVAVNPEEDWLIVGAVSSGDNYLLIYDLAETPENPPLSVSKALPAENGGGRITSVASRGSTVAYVVQNQNQIFFDSLPTRQAIQKTTPPPTNAPSGCATLSHGAASVIGFFLLFLFI